MTTEPETTKATPKRRSRVGLYAFVLILVAGGFYAGMHWRADGGDNAAKGAADQAQALWTCGMHPQVLQDHPGLCPICHMQLTPLKASTDAGQATPQTPSDPSGQGAAKERKVKYWWDPMLSPPYIADKPGKSPMGMDLIPVYEDEVSGSGSQVVIDPAVVQNMGVRVAMVTEGPLAKTVRLVGYLDEAQPNIHEINLRVSGWIRRLYANTEGQHLQAGDPLFDLYSPDLQVAVEELINGRRAQAALPADADESSRQTAATLYDAAASKLELLGLARAQIETLAKLDKAPPAVTFVSPIMGHLVEKPVIEGAAVKAGDRVLRIVDHTTLWLDAQVFEKDLPFVKIGQKVVATIASQPGEPISGEIIFIHPHVDMMTRTAMVRMAIPNASLDLKPGMYATVHARAELAERAVMVPREAIIDQGNAQMCFVAQAVGKFEPRKVQMGLPGEDGMVQVMQGLAPGEVVVTSGQFLLDSESRLREAIQKYLNQKQQAAAKPANSKPAEQVAPARMQKVDAVVSAYLDIADALGREQENTTPIDVSTLVAGAHSLHGEVLGTDLEPLAIEVAKATEAMRGDPIEQQRERFKALSKQVIALVDAQPPSRALGDQLFVMHCPMKDGSWIQRSKDLANPFYATEMKTCGSLLRAVSTQRGQ